MDELFLFVSLPKTPLLYAKRCPRDFVAWLNSKNACPSLLDTAAAITSQLRICSRRVWYSGLGSTQSPFHPYCCSKVYELERVTASLAAKSIKYPPVLNP